MARPKGAKNKAKGSAPKRDLTGRKAGKPSKADLKAVAASISVADKQKKLLAARDEMNAINAANELLVSRRRSVRESIEGIGLSKTGFDLAIRLNDMDGTERADYLDSLGFTLETFGLTKQGDLFGAEPGTTDADDHCDRADAEGFRAAADGRNRDANPYAPDTSEQGAWNEGWDRQTAEHAAQMGANKAAPKTDQMLDRAAAAGHA